MRPTTKYLIYGGIATAIIGPALISQTMISVGLGTGTFAAVTVHDGLPAATQGFQSYKPSDTHGLFGERLKGAPSASPSPQ